MTPAEIIRAASAGNVPKHIVMRHDGSLSYFIGVTLDGVNLGHDIILEVPGCNLFAERLTVGTLVITYPYADIVLCNSAVTAIKGGRTTRLYLENVTGLCETEGNVLQKPPVASHVNIIAGTQRLSRIYCIPGLHRLSGSSAGGPG